MLTYIVRRILSSLPVLVGILFVTFALGRLIPGDPCRAILGEKATDAVCDEFIHRHGLDRPIATQFAIYVGEILRGDLGTSLKYGKPVTDLIVERLPTTVELSLAAMTFSVILGIPLGIISAVRHNSAIDVGTMMIANVGVSMPVFWLGLMLAYVFALLLKDTPLQLPPSGRLSPGLSVPAFFDVWGWKVATEGIGYQILYFFSRLNTINAVLTWRWDIFWDAARHLVLPGLAVGGDKFRWQHRGEELDRRAQAAQRNARLVDEFRFATRQQAFFVALEMLQAAERNAAKGFDGRLLFIDRHRFAFEWAERFVEKQGVATFGLAGDGGVKLVLLLQLAGQAKDVFHFAVE